MAPDALTPTKPRKIQRLQIGLNVLIQVVLLLLLGAMVNSLAIKRFKRWDFSRDHQYGLSDKTKRFLDTIKGKVRISVFFGNTSITADVQNLLKEYHYTSKGKVDIENIDPDRNLSRANELLAKYKVVRDENLLILDYEGRNRILKATEMAEVGPDSITAFKGEQAVTGALIELVEGTKNTVGYVVGHKEPSIAEALAPNPMEPETNTRSMRVMRTFIENENIKFQELNLFEVAVVPADLKAIMIVGPQYDFSEREMKLLRDFWEKQGRILLLLDPAAKTPRLHAFLFELGVKVNDDRLMAMFKTGIEEVALVRDVQASFMENSPITKRLAKARGIFPGGTSSLTLEPDRMRATANIRSQPLVQAENSYWAEADYNSEDQAKFLAHRAQNAGATHTLAVSIEKGGSADERVQTNSSRLVVVTNATFIEDTAIQQDQQALDFISGCANWLLNRETLIGIAPKIPQTLRFSVEDGALRKLRWLVLFVVPLVPAVLGFAVWWHRRT